MVAILPSDEEARTSVHWIDHQGNGAAAPFEGCANVKIVGGKEYVDLRMGVIPADAFELNSEALDLLMPPVPIVPSGTGECEADGVAFAVERGQKVADHYCWRGTVETGFVTKQQAAVLTLGVLAQM